MTKEKPIVQLIESIYSYVPEDKEVLQLKKIECPDTSTLNLNQSMGFVKFLSFSEGQLYKDVSGSLKQVDMLILAGFAGTGKTYLNTIALQMILFRNPTFKIAIATPTHQAGTSAFNMSALQNIPNVSFVTIHSLAGVRVTNDQETGKEIFTPSEPPLFEEYDLVFIDEAGMVASDLFDIIRIYSKKVKIILTGDAGQVPPVGESISQAYNEDIDFYTDGITDYVTDRVELSIPMRAGKESPITYYATKIRKRSISRYDIKPLLKEEGSCISHPCPKDRENGVDEYLDAVLLAAFDNEHYAKNSHFAKLVTWSNKSVGQWNRRIRLLIHRGNNGGVLAGNPPVLFEREFIKLSSQYVVERVNPDGEVEEDIIYKNNETLRVIDYEETEFLFVGINKKVKLLMCSVERRYKNSWIPRSKVPVVLSSEMDKYKTYLREMWEYVKFHDPDLRSVYWNIVKFGPCLARYDYASTVHKRQGCTDHISIIDAKNIGACKYYPKNIPTAIREDTFWRLWYTASTRADTFSLQLI